MEKQSWWRSALGIGADEARANPALSLQQWLDYFTFNGTSYPIMPTAGLLGSQQTIDVSFTGYVQGALKANGVVFACELVRVMLFSEATFQYRRFENGRPGDLFGDATLGPLHRPWPGGTTGDLLSIMLLDADFAGNAFIARQGPRLRRLRPDWVTIVYGAKEKRKDFSPWDVDAEVVGYLYLEGGPERRKDPVSFLPEQVAHFMPMPDPLAPGKGMSWLTPVLREIMSDAAGTQHKQAFFENGATVNLALEYDPQTTKELFEFAVDKFNEGHQGAANAYKTLHLLGAKANPIGIDLGAMSFKEVQGAGETRIAAAAGVPPVIVGLSEGLQAATYSNYGQARRRFADGTMRPLWRNVASSLERIMPAPSNAELWYDARDIAFLAEDAKDAADIQQTQSLSTKALIDAGFDAASVVAAITSGDMAKLKHTGLFSVQLQPPMPDGPPPAAVNGANAARALKALMDGSLTGAGE